METNKILILEVKKRKPPNLRMNLGITQEHT